jgi:hypothetical protein
VSGAGGKFSTEGSPGAEGKFCGELCDAGTLCVEFEFCPHPETAQQPASAA